MIEQQQQDTTNIPGARKYHSLLYFKPHNSLLLYGGTSSDGRKDNEIFEFDISKKRWTKLAKNSTNGLSDLPEPMDSVVFEAICNFVAGDAKLYSK